MIVCVSKHDLEWSSFFLSFCASEPEGLNKHSMNLPPSLALKRNDCEMNYLLTGLNAMNISGAAFIFLFQLHITNVFIVTF